MKVDYDQMTKNFILTEGQASPSINSYIQSMSEMIDKLTPRNLSDTRRIEMARENLLNIRRHVRRLEEKNRQLEEQVKVIQEQEK